jgi:hypothetical protein
MPRESHASRFRIFPRRLGAAFSTAFMGLFLAVWMLILAASYLSEGGTVTWNGREVFGEEREEVLRSSNFILTVPIIPMIIALAFNASRLLPRSPFDFIEIGPEGLTVRSPFRRRCRPWAEITGFSSGNFPFSNSVIKVEAASPLKFSIAHYIRPRLFSFQRSDMPAIVEWLDRLREAYVFGGGSLPAPPQPLKGRVIPLSQTSDVLSSVIEL